jgi:nucleoside-diphosphate kinase
MAERWEIRLSGAGGDGMLTAGKILGAAAVIYDEKYATHSQSYGPEARGGACRSEVIISDREVENPKASRVNVLLALTQEACEKYVGDVVEGGIVVVDVDHVSRIPSGHFTVYRLPFKAKAMEEFGTLQAASVIALGAVVALRPVVSRQGLETRCFCTSPRERKRSTSGRSRWGIAWPRRPREVKRSMVERTLSIVKPDGVQKGLVGEVFRRFEAAGLQIVALKMVHLTRAQAEGFYHVHRERPFFQSLCDFMTSGPVVVSVLEGEGAIQKNRDLMGATDPARASPGTIRREFAQSIERNIVHGSDGPQTAAFEIGYFFNALEIHPHERQPR